jgi:hypothetical protein
MAQTAKPSMPSRHSHVAPLALTSAGAFLRLSEHARALFFLWSDWGRPQPAALKGTKSEAWDRTGFTARFRHPDDYRPRKRYVWGTKAKPSGVGAPTALLF